MASDGKWYPPESHPNYTEVPPSGTAPATPSVPGRFVAAGVDYELAGWWGRVGAALIDFLIAWVLPILFAVGVGLTLGPIVGIIVGFIGLLCGWAYPSIMTWKTDGRTVGKRVAGIRVVRESGEPFDAGTAFLREFAVKGIAVSIANSATAGGAGLLNALWPLWDDQNRAIHDMLVATRVVKDDH
jgi:uncharacterized RDD family membrane protein YckC